MHFNPKEFFAMNKITQLQKQFLEKTSAFNEILDKNLPFLGRKNTLKLDTTARNYTIIAENIAMGSVFADATQNALAEIILLAKKVQDIGDKNLTNYALQEYGSEFLDQLSLLMDTTVDDIKILQNEISINIGLNSGTIEVGVDLRRDSSYNALHSTLTDMTLNPSVPPTNMDPIIDGLSVTLSIQSHKSVFLENRYATLNDLILSYKEAANDQVITTGSSPSSLLDKIL